MGWYLSYPKIRQHKINARLFWAKVRRTDFCWFWTGQTNRGGYGVHCKSVAHRIGWELTRGPIPMDKDKCFVLHTCDNRRCVNPNHLYLGSKKENGRDSSVRKRYEHRRGESATRSKLTEAQVLEIRRLCAIPGANKSEVARQFGITNTHACGIALI
jgi:hypothetical protein